MAIQFQNPKEYIAELIGTMIFIAIGCTVAAYAWRGGSSLMVAFGFAAAFIGLIYCIGKVSDCHFNPLITLSMFINGRMNAADTLFYVLAQIIGGILGAIFSFFLVSQSPALFPNNNVIVYPSVYGGSFPYMVGIEVIGAFLLEMFFAFILCYIVLKATESRKIEMKSGAIIAAAMFALIYFGCMVTYTAVNPAKSIGAAFAMLFSGVQDKSEPLIQLWLEKGKHDQHADARSESKEDAPEFRGKKGHKAYGQALVRQVQHHIPRRAVNHRSFPRLSGK